MSTLLQCHYLQRSLVFAHQRVLTLSKGKLKHTLEEVIKICKEVYLFLRLWQVFYNGTEIVPQNFKRFESSRCWNSIPYMDSLMGLRRMEIMVLEWSFVYITLTVSSQGWVLGVALIILLKFPIIDWARGLTNLQSLSYDCWLKRIGILKNFFISLSFRHL